MLTDLTDYTLLPMPHPDRHVAFSQHHATDVIENGFLTFLAFLAYQPRFYSKNEEGKKSKVDKVSIDLPEKGIIKNYKKNKNYPRYEPENQLFIVFILFILFTPRHSQNHLLRIVITGFCWYFFSLTFILIKFFPKFSYLFKT